MRPESAKSVLAAALASCKLIDDDVANLFSDIKSMRVIELGGIGIIAEYLSAHNEVRLCEETRLFFVFRRHLLPKSTVIEINVDPRTLKYSKPYYDLVVIHGPAYLEQARMLSRNLIYDASTKTFERVVSATINTEVDQSEPKDVVDTKEFE